ncbi:MAG: hypothetical protein EOP34_11980 [Rickettsiales bacterium]|nr:MAG: hypothetical protein EOP34_11980 [Rickettsiales bacterium]
MTTGSVDIVIKINYANDMIKLYKINYLSKILDTSLENINFGITQDTNTMYMIDLLVYGLDEKKIDWFISSKTSIVKIKSLNTVQIAETQTTALANYKASNLNQTIQSVDVTNTSSNGMEYLIELIIDINNYVYHVITSSFKGSNDLNKLDVNWTFSKTLNNYVNAFPNGIKITANIVCTSDNTYSTYVTNTNDNTSQAFRGYSVVFSKNDLSNYNWIEDTSQNN